MIPVEAMRAWVTDPRSLVLLPGCGHWIKHERPREVNAALIAFLRGLGTG